jgi:hypothetical protein
MRRIMLGDRPMGAGVQEARLKIMGGMMPGDNTHREANLERAYQLGRDLGAKPPRPPGRAA